MQNAADTTRASAIGLLAGIVGSLCCLGPTAAVLFGLGASSALAGLAFERWQALGGGGALLIGGLLLARRQMRACALAGRARMRQPAIVLLTFALTYGLLGYILPELAARQTDAATALVARPAPAAHAAIRRATLIVEKMNCPPCAAHVRGLLARKPYVQSFAAEFSNEQVTIDYDSQQITARDLVRLFPRAFGITLVSDQVLS